MKYVIMVGHGESTPGLHSAVKMMTGERDNVLSTSLKTNISADKLVANFRTLAEPLNTDDGVTLLADILSGSPFTSALAVLDEKGLMPNTLVIVGMNMSLAITAILMEDNFDDAELLKETLLGEDHTGFAEFKIESDDVEDDI